MKKLGEILEKYLQNLGIDSGKKTLFSSWEEIAGKEIAQNSTIVDIKNNILMIETAHPGWIQIINLKKIEILKKIEKNFPDKKIIEIKTILKKRIAPNN